MYDLLIIYCCSIVSSINDELATYILFLLNLFPDIIRPTYRRYLGPLCWLGLGRMYDVAMSKFLLVTNPMFTLLLNLQ